MVDRAEAYSAGGPYAQTSKQRGKRMIGPEVVVGRVVMVRGNVGVLWQCGVL